MDIKVLNLEDFNINDFSKEDTIDINLFDEDISVFYSYPYYSHKDIDYQFRFSFNDTNVCVEEVKNDNSKDFDSLTILKNLGNIERDLFNEYLLKLIDFRDGTTELIDGIINLNLDLLDTNEKFRIINSNKIYVLYEIYNNFIE